VAQAIDRLIGALAASQRGYVARWQLLERGLTDHAIRWRIRTGRLIRVHPGVYAVGHVRTAPIDRASAAVLACGPGAVLSHLSAAALWGFVKGWEESFEVTVARDRRPEGIHVYRAPLGRGETIRQLGIPVTIPARTVLDCAHGLDDRRLTRLVNEAFVSPPYLKEAALAEVLNRHPNHRGARRLWHYAEEGHGRTRSDLEDKFVAFVERFDLPMPELNFPMDGRVLDAFYPDERVIVEIDSYGFHKPRAVFEADREKDAAATAKGLATVRLTDRRMERDGPGAAGELRQTLERRAA
jgi:predicted transcriptional regulator of viral defense system